VGVFSQSKKGGTSKSFMVDFVSKAENAFNKMKTGVDLEALQSEYTQGTLYRAFSKYFDWAEQSRVNLSRKNREFENEIKEKKKSINGLAKKIMDEDKRHESLKSQKTRLEGFVDERQKQFNELVQKINSINSKINSLEERGVTEETITRIVRIDFKTGNELTERIATNELYNDLVSQAESLKEEIDNQELRKENIEKELERMFTEMMSVRNTLDDEKRKLWTFRESQEIVEDFLNNGYDKEILFSLNVALKALQITDDPKSSLTRLLDGLKGVKNLDELYSQVRAESSKLKELEERVDVASGTLSAIEDNAIAQIRSLKNEVLSELRELNSDNINNLKRTALAQKNELREFKKSTERGISEISDHFSNRINSSLTSLDKSIQEYRGEIAQWGEMKQERGKHERMMTYGTILMGVLENPREELPQVPLDVITKLVDRIATWLHLTMPDVSAKPTDLISQQEPHLHTFREYRLVSLLDVVNEHLGTLLYRPPK
jgi:chromosome segregation ATPase